MLNVKIIDTIYELPSNWDEINVGMFLNISKLEFESEFYDYQIKLLSILLNCNYYILIDSLKDTNGMVKLIQSIQWINEPITINEIITHEINSIEYKLFTNFKKITFGDWISIETLIKANPKESIIRIIYILLKDSNGEHPLDLERSLEAIKTLPITNLMNTYKNFLEYRKNIYIMYSGYFKMNETETDNIEDEIDKRAGLYKSTNLSKWMWLMIVEKLCERLNYIPEQVYEMNLIGALNWSSMIKEKQDYEIEQTKK